MRWTKKDDAVLLFHYRNRPYADFKDIFPYRTVAAIRNRIWRLGKPKLPHWTKAESELIVQAYLENQGKKDGWLKRLGQLLHRKPSNLSWKARRLGLATDKRRIKGPHPYRKIGKWDGLTEKQKTEQRSMMKKEWYRTHEHPRGMLGKTHTPEVRKLIAAAHLGKTRIMSLQHRTNMAIARQRLLRESPASFARVHRKGKFGRRVDLDNRFFRSTYEANYARFLNYAKIEWEYETKTFWFEKIRRGVRSYTPDFYIKKTGEYHEVKGWMDAKSLTKLKRMKKYYPDVKVIVIDRTWFQSANRQGLCRLIPHWECQHKTHQREVVNK